MRDRSDELEAILGRSWKVLDDGFVRVIDYLGCDSSVVQAARVSYGAGTKTIREDDALIRFLLRHQHTSPFEMCEIKFHVRVPMDTWRQWIRHRTANVNEYSTRYSVAIDSQARTAASDWRMQSTANRQGSEDSLEANAGTQLTLRESELLRMARAVYAERLEAGVAREQARKDLPLSTYTEAYWKVDLHNLLRFLHLRMAPTAQHEIRAYANVIGREIVARWCPLTWAAFEDYVIGALVLSVREQAVARPLARGDLDSARMLAESFEWLAKDGRRGRNRREGSEAAVKLRSLGFSTEWLDDEAKAR